ncbi:GNAT family N-acetyltransferase [Enterovibrio calviensis]|uniref:GNAT family N-acetyltransferase n=1 Tax=Enterovibrio calviensis TaxID=91359 RepID=UPI000B32C017|nr:GNAT family N-acetyltransferase [Enterovibrio calviensis]
MTKPIEFVFLADKPELIPTLANWYFNEWGTLANASLEDFTQKLGDYLNIDKIPLLVIAMDGTTPVGAAHLRFHEMSIYPDKEHWIGGVYVDAPYRGQHIASALVQQIVTSARHLGVKQLHLQTEQLDGGLYAKLGWQEIEQVDSRGVDVSVRVKAL